MSTRRRADGVYSSPAPRDAAGNKLCRNCRGPLPKGKPHNCSPECSEEWRGKTSPSYMRYLVHKRDRGICALCGLDCDALWEAVKWVNKHLNCEYSWDHKSERIEFKYAFGFQRWPGELWDADHITPVVEGGGECGLDNYRTLCIPCHKKETAELARRLAENRHREKAEKLPLPLFDV